MGRGEVMDDIIEEILSLEAEMEGQRYSEGEQACATPAQRSYSQPDCLSFYSSLQFLGYDPLKPCNSYPPDRSQTQRRDVIIGQTPFGNQREQRRKQSHNMFERRRRSIINERIRELATLLPRSEMIRDTRHSTGQILKSSVDYIRRLKQEVGRVAETEARLKAVEVENQQLRSQVQYLEARLQEKARASDSSTAGHAL